MKCLPPFITCLIAVSLVSSPAIHAEWSTDPAVNLSIADRTADQVQPKIAPTADGGCYISWLDNAAGGYDVYLQRLDAAGDEQWAHNGVLIADRSFSSTVEYGLDVDSSGNALLAFRDDRFGTTGITAVKVDPSGAMLWGANGVQLAGYGLSSRIAATSDGNVVVGWNNAICITLQKLDAAGSTQWGEGVYLMDEEADYFLIADLHASDAGSVIVSWVKYSMVSDDLPLWAQKLSPDGATLWNAPGPHVVVFDGDSLQPGIYPTFSTDGSGGAIFSWHGCGMQQCYAQRILADGSEQFAHNGVAVSTNATRMRFSPHASYDPATGDIFVFWTEWDPVLLHGVYGQRLAGSGLRLWGVEGRVLVSPDSGSRTEVNTLRDVDGTMVFYIESPGDGNKVIKATRVDGNGDFSWTGDIVTAGSLPSSKGSLTAAMSAEGYAILSWSDDRPGGHTDIIGQNVNADGTLGYVSTSTVSTDLTCLPGWGTVPFSAAFTVTINNDCGDQTRRMAGRIDVTLANGSNMVGWRAGFTNIAAGSSFTAAWNSTIPAVGPVIGTNTFALVAEDVTPAPFNQPPYPPAGDTRSDWCVVQGYAP